MGEIKSETLLAMNRALVCQIGDYADAFRQFSDRLCEDDWLEISQHLFQLENAAKIAQKMLDVTGDRQV